jgi:MraZ protein
MMFGFNNISIDKKGRFSFPAKYRDAFINSNESQIVITKDPQYPSLKVYLGSEWDQISNKLSSLQGLDPIVRNLQWTILGNASVSDFEPNGRMQVLISADLKKYAQIEDTNRICLIGMGNKFEIWNQESWEQRQTGGSLATEILDIVLPESIKDMSF